jgi:DGQHR domain-containing protein
MDIYALKIKQWGYGEGAKECNLYLTSLTVGQLSLRADIDRWTKDNRSGYQRPPLEARLKQTGGASVVKYLLEEAGIFPTSVLLNVRRKLDFKEELKITDEISYGMLSIPDDEKLWIVDGQHRLEALKRASSIKPELEKYPVPVTIMDLNDKFDEMLLFYIVNSRQRRIPTDIAYRHLQSMVEKVEIEEKYGWVKKVLLGPPERRKGLAALIVDYLASDTESPFYNRIRFLGEEKESWHLIEDSVLIRYISKLLSEKTFSLMDPANIASLLIEYWKAIEELYPSCFREGESESYTLLKHTGVASLTYLFPTIYSYCMAEADISREKMKELLGYLKEEIDDPKLPLDYRIPIDERWWSRAHGPSIAKATSERVFNELAENFSKKISIALSRKRGSNAGR